MVPIEVKIGFTLAAIGLVVLLVGIFADFSTGMKKPAWTKVVNTGFVVLASALLELVFCAVYHMWAT